MVIALAVKFTYDDLNQVLAKVEVMPDTVEEILEAWGIDDDGFMKFILEGARPDANDLFKLLTNPTALIAQSMIVGFQLGYQTAMEMELRRK